MIQDSIADCLTRVRNASMADKDQVSVAHSKIKEEVLQILKREGFLGSVEVVQDTKSPNKKTLVATIKYRKSGKPRLEHIKRVSKPGLRVYSQAPKKLSVRSGLGLQILTTSKGIMTDREAMEKKLGGEVICELW
ncbi:MAG: 30S ribosomal protein S8 [Deltaproteobacteria bacterium CG11_big_fil_rev_8_21_14_0_20_45_16]|nr:MAG: 30S ribosomal protein S8 [Deltaproteobacteria bacterium CG11_big_fil_rev_8_21_14_0_20_45_16]